MYLASKHARTGNASAHTRLLIVLHACSRSNMSCRCNSYQITHMQVVRIHKSRLDRTTQGLTTGSLEETAPEWRARFRVALRECCNKHVQAHTVLWQQEQEIGAAPFPAGAVQNLCLGSSLQPVDADMMLLHCRVFVARASSVH